MLSLRRIGTFFLLSVVATCLTASPVSIIKGSTNLPPAERRFAQSLALHASRWLTTDGARVLLLEDRELARATRESKVLIWVCPAELPPGQIKLVREFVARGGRLIVCYSNSRELAQLMGVELLGYRKAPSAQAWSEMRLKENRIKGAPTAIAQVSSNILAIRPKGKSSSVLATWCNGTTGRESGEVAWVSSPQGWWCSHVLLGDGDAHAKSTFLFALCASVDPQLWSDAARKQLSECETLVSKTRIRQRIGALTSKRADRLKKQLKYFEATLASAQQDLRRGRAYNAYQQLQACQTLIAELYGALQPPRAGEIRGVWDHSGVGLYPGDWPRTCRLLRDAGLTDIYINVAGAGFAHYNSHILPVSRTYHEYGDQLKVACIAAHAVGLRVHAWLLCFSTERSSVERMMWFRQRGWLLKDDLGQPRHWLDPSNSAVQQYLLSAVAELASYPVDGVHLDFVRYPDGKTKLEGTAKRRWQEQRRELITDFVQAASKTSRRKGRRVPLSVAVYGKYPSCVWSVGQDWMAWLRMGTVNFVLPMNYTEDNAKYQQWLAQQTAHSGLAKRVISGIGVTAAESRLGAINVIDQIIMAREHGTAGFALFDLDTTLRNEILPVLRLGITSKR